MKGKGRRPAGIYQASVGSETGQREGHRSSIDPAFVQIFFGAGKCFAGGAAAAGSSVLLFAVRTSGWIPYGHIKAASARNINVNDFDSALKTIS